jgi:site-specific recombinase XerD
MLLDGDARARPRSPASLYIYFAAVQPLIGRWSADRGHLREVTADDIEAVLDLLRGHQLRTTTVAVRSLFRFARKRGLVFANPAARLKAADPGGSLLPMTDAEIRAAHAQPARPDLREDRPRIQARQQERPQTTFLANPAKLRSYQALKP